MRAHLQHLQHRTADRWSRTLPAPQPHPRDSRVCGSDVAGTRTAGSLAAGVQGLRQRFGATLLIIAVTALAGCGPVTTASVIHDAEHDLGEVKSLDGEKNAPYEYTKAASYLHKAKELQGHGLYEQASTYARRSRLLSEKAIEVARLAQERSQRKAKFGGKKAKKGPPSFTPSGGGGR